MRSTFVSFIFIFFSLLSFTCHAQDSSIVYWTAQSKKITNDRYEIQLKGQLRKGWHIYTAADDVDGLSGIIITIKDSAITSQGINITTAQSNYSDVIFEKRSKKIVNGYIEIKLPITVSGQVPPAFKLQLNYETGFTENFIPEEQNIVVSLEGGVIAKMNNRILIPSIKVDKPLTDCKSGFFLIFSRRNQIQRVTDDIFPWFFRWPGGIAYSLCISNDTTDSFVFYEKSYKPKSWNP
jgi:hypothetical protein